MDDPAPRMDLRWMLVIVALCFLSYAMVLIYGGWIWDDPDYVLTNPTLRDVGGLAKIWTDPTATPQYYPLVHTSYFVEYQLVGPTDPSSSDVPATLFHFDNVILFALTALCFWAVLLRLRIRGALLAVLLFVVHPVNVESVAWVTERKNMLSGLFAMLTVLCFLRFMRIGDDGDDGRPSGNRTKSFRWGWFYVAMLAWICGLFSKTIIAFVPPALFLVVWWKRPRDTRCWQLLIALSVLLAPGIVAGLHTSYLEETLVGASDSLFPEIDGFPDRLMLSGTIVWVYLKHLLLPYPQMFFYPKWDPSPASWWQWALLLSALALPVLLLWKSRVLGRGPLVAVLVFGGALFPVMGFHNVFPMKISWVADHFQYHANFAILALVGALLVRVPVPRKLGIAAFAVVLAGFAALANHHGKAFESSEMLYRRTLEHNDGVLIAWQNLGIDLSNKARDVEEAGRPDDAKPLFEEAHECYKRALQLGRESHLLETVAAFYVRRFQRSNDTSDLDIAERLAKECDASLVRADVFFWRGPAHRGRAIEHFERAISEMISARRQSAYARWKLTTHPGKMAVERMVKCCLDYGHELLRSGDAAGALAAWSRPRAPWNGPGTEPLNEIYSWPLGRTTRWFALELHRVWMLAANADVRDPRRALAELAHLAKQAPQRFRGGGVGENQARVALAFAMDAQAAALAGAGRFEDAVLVSRDVLKQLAGQVTEDWLATIRARERAYGERKAFQFRKDIPVPPGLQR